MERLENDRGQVEAENIQTAVDVWLGWPTALLQLDYSGRYLCSLHNTGERLLLTGKGPETQTRRSELVASGEKLHDYFLIVGGDVSAHLYVTPGSNSYI